MRTVFFGTPAWAVPALDALLDAGTEVAAVVTNPDRPAGRGMELRPPPVKRRAGELGLRVLQPDGARDPGLHHELTALAPDVAVVVAYGKIIPAGLLQVPARGFVNLHFSLLPAYRGAAPVQRALMDGVARTGVTIIVLTEGMDEGPIVASEAVGVGPDETAGELGDRLALVGARLLARVLPEYVRGAVVPEPQDHAAATYAPKVGDDEARVDWRLPAGRIHDLVRACNPAPGAWTTLRGRRVKLHRVRPAAGAASRPSPAEPVAEAGRLLAGTGDQPLELVEVQLEGRRRLSGQDLSRGLRLAPGERFE